MVMKTQPSGIYIHIPFCIRKCPYCDFYSTTDLSLRQAFLESLLCEMERVSRNVNFHFDSLYIGGGTPSVLEAKDIDRIINTAYKYFRMLPDAEITAEVNPGTVTSQKLKDYRSSGINRLNIGVQSFQDENLHFLGRIHSAQEAYSSVRHAQQAGFENIGLDFIYGIPSQSEKSWFSDLQTAVELSPAHLSCYTLTYEQGTVMEANLRKGQIQPLPEDEAAALFEATGVFLAQHGYERYEISNFARSVSERSRHNQKYWSGVPYLGFGPSAHSFLPPERYWNLRSVKAYIEAVKSGRLPAAEREILTEEQQITEAIFLGLRKSEGIDIDAFDKKFDKNFKALFGEVIKNLETEGLITTEKNHCALSARGMLLLDSVVSMFLLSASL
jgi:oxygen-independent coproporphyrinogen-3 oxidase